MSKSKKNWQKIKEFLEETGVTMREIYSRIQRREWYDGYVIKKTPTGRIKWGCKDDYDTWSGTA